MQNESGELSSELLPNEALQNETSHAKNSTSSLSSIFSSLGTFFAGDKRPCLFDITIQMLKLGLTTDNTLSKEALKVDESTFNKIKSIIAAVNDVLIHEPIIINERWFEISRPDHIQPMIVCLEAVRNILENSQVSSNEVDKNLYINEIPELTNSLSKGQRGVFCRTTSDLKASSFLGFEALFKVLYEKLGGTKKNYTYKLDNGFIWSTLEIDADVVNYLKHALFAKLEVRDKGYAISITAIEEPHPQSESDSDSDSDYSSAEDDIESNLPRTLVSTAEENQSSSCLVM